MGERLFGLETEYAIAGIARDNGGMHESLLDRFLEHARESHSYLPDGRSGLFLGNGSRLYIDCGHHPELSTPECINPWDAVRYLKAGERIIDAILNRMIAERGVGAEIVCSLCNVDYLENTTWGCHESYLHRCSTQLLPRHIIPHLVTRTIYTGAGGFNPFSEGLEFTLSPRAAHITHVTSSNSTSERGIFHTKDESLSSAGYHRLHIICGESLCSEEAIWLKVGATALVVAMIEAGLHPGYGVELGSPLDALRAVAADTGCRTKLELTGGRTASALEIQRRYLSLAEIHVKDSFMPPWAGEVCTRWRRMLDALESAPETLRKILDWAIKDSIYTRHIESNGMDWKEICSWNHVVGRLRASLDRTWRRRSLRPEVILGVNSPILEDVARLTPYLRENGLRWDRLAKFLELKQAMLEIDMRFGQIGEKGIFRSLDRSGLLEHHVQGIDNIDYAVTHPPDGSRARIRGEIIRYLTCRSETYRSNWSVIHDAAGKPLFDLSDPFGNSDEWSSVGAADTRHGHQYTLPGIGEDDIRLRDVLRMRGHSL